jgi:hypothetical protein
MTSAEGGENKGSDEMLQKDEELSESDRESSEKGGFLSQLVGSIGELIRKVTGKGEEEKDEEKSGGTKKSPGLNTNVLLIVLTVVLALNLIIHFAKG